MPYFHCLGACKDRVFVSSFDHEQTTKTNPPCPMCEGATERVPKPKLSKKKKHDPRRKYLVTRGVNSTFPLR